MQAAFKKLLAKLDKLSFEQLFYIKKKKKKINYSIVNALTKQLKEMKTQQSKKNKNHPINHC